MLHKLKTHESDQYTQREKTYQNQNSMANNSKFISKKHKEQIISVLKSLFPRDQVWQNYNIDNLLSDHEDDQSNEAPNYYDINAKWEKIKGFEK